MKAGAQCSRMCVLLIAASATCVLGAPDAKWGRVEDYLQLGLEWSASSTPVIRVLLRNAGSATREFPAGFVTSTGPMSNVAITAAPDQQSLEQRVYDLDVLKAHPGGPIHSDKLHVKPGAVHVFTFPIKRLICVVDRQEVPLENLLNRGFSVRASFGLPGVRLITPDLRLPRR